MQVTAAAVCCARVSLEHQAPALERAQAGNHPDTLWAPRAGQLRAVCTFSLPDKRADALAAAAGFRLIYAMGPMGGRGSPGLGNHAGERQRSAGDEPTLLACQAISPGLRCG
jgi:hypothetical protein